VDLQLPAPGVVGRIAGAEDHLLEPEPLFGDLGILGRKGGDLAVDQVGVVLASGHSGILEKLEDIAVARHQDYVSCEEHGRLAAQPGVEGPGIGDGLLAALHELADLCGEGGLGARAHLMPYSRSIVTVPPQIL